eukprot:SAG31_NODE_3584_length_4100_cov_1.957761_5_plen_83_part_00
MVLDAGGDVNTQNNNGQTALHMSVAYDYFWTTKLLLEAGADRSLVNEDGHKAEVGIDGTLQALPPRIASRKKMTRPNSWWVS